MNPEKELAQLLKKSGAVLIRSKKHNVYRLPNGQIHSVSKSPSDFRTTRNSIKYLKKQIQNPEK